MKTRLSRTFDDGGEGAYTAGRRRAGSSGWRRCGCGAAGRGRSSPSRWPAPRS